MSAAPWFQQEHQSARPVIRAVPVSIASPWGTPLISRCSNAAVAASHRMGSKPLCPSRCCCCCCSSTAAVAQAHVALPPTHPPNKDQHPARHLSTCACHTPRQPPQLPLQGNSIRSCAGAACGWLRPEQGARDSADTHCCCLLLLLLPARRQQAAPGSCTPLVGSQQPPVPSLW